MRETTTTTPAIGADAPPSDTLTATDPATLVAISTDEHPDLAFYALSVKDAIAAGKPFVLVFATPLFCTQRHLRAGAGPRQAGRARATSGG